MFNKSYTARFHIQLNKTMPHYAATATTASCHTSIMCLCDRRECTSKKQIHRIIIMIIKENKKKELDIRQGQILTKKIGQKIIINTE